MCGINHLFHKAVGLEINQPGRILECQNSIQEQETEVHLSTKTRKQNHL